MKQRVGIVEDDLHARVGHLVGELLGGGGWDGQDGHHDVLLVDHVANLGLGADLQVADLSPHLPLVVVEHRHHAEAVVGEDVGGGDRRAQVAGSEQRDVVLSRGPKDLADLGHKRVDVVAHAALAELSEPREIAPDLRGVHMCVVGELL